MHSNFGLSSYYTEIALYYNVWPGAIFDIETESKRVNKLVYMSCTFCDWNQF